MRPDSVHGFPIVLGLLVLLLPGCDSAITDRRTSSYEPDSRVSFETYRPEFHFTPEQNWMNDPNGLVYHDGTYHLFYQYNPYGTQWGNLSWGHAVSTNLVHWERKGVAIPVEDNLQIWSGSAVVDENNTSGFGTTDDPAMVAVFTGVRLSDGNQSQYLAYSTDDGESWTKYAGNPVLDIGSTNFRDPKVFWYEPDQKWVMLVSLPLEHKVLFYESENLKDWSQMSTFGPAGATGGLWEMPDLFKLPVDGGADRDRWVLALNLNPGGAAGGSGAQYFVGAFDGIQFTADDIVSGTGVGKAGWIDFGKDFYASLSWNNIPESDGRRIWIAWMNNWQYAESIPTSPWRGALTFPRRVKLKEFGEGVRLVQQPVEEVRTLRGEGVHLEDMTVPEGATSLEDQGVFGNTLEIQATFDVGSATDVGLKVHEGTDQETLIEYNAEVERLFVDRTQSGAVGFSSAFPGQHSAPLPLDNGQLELRVLVDRSSVEVFAADGSVSITERVFPNRRSDGVSVYAEGGSATLESLTSWSLFPIWSP